MRVRAIGEVGVIVGYYDNKRIRGGSVFELKDKKEFSKNWMEKVDADIRTVTKKEKPRDVMPLAAGNKAIHTGKINEPKKKQSKQVPEPEPDPVVDQGPEVAPEPKPVEDKQSTGEQDVI